MAKCSKRISGTMNKGISHPHNNSLSSISCQIATKEKIAKEFTILFLDPPRGMYM
jgi:hypothetical protein